MYIFKDQLKLLFLYTKDKTYRNIKLFNEYVCSMSMFVFNEYVLYNKSFGLNCKRDAQKQVSNLCFSFLC